MEDRSGESNNAGKDGGSDQDRTPGKVTGGMREDDGDQPVLVFKTPDRCKKEDGGGGHRPEQTKGERRWRENWIMIN